MSADRRVRRGKTDKGDRKAVSSPLSAGSWPRRRCSGRCWQRERSCASRQEQSALPEGAALGWAALRICLVTPLAEELAFRGGALYLLQPLGGRAAVVVQALLFAGLHGSWTARAYALGMGLIFGWAARKAESVWPGSALHMINNCLVFAARLAERGMG